MSTVVVNGVRLETGIRYTIVACPSKFDLMMAIFGDKHVVEYTIEEATTETTRPEHSAVVLATIPVKMLSVGREDGSGENWLVKGFVSMVTGCCKINGYCNTLRRRGWIEFLPL